jgi:hypothetical protein
MLCHEVSWKLTGVLVVLTDSIIRAMMEAVITSETSVNFYEITWHSSPTYFHLQIEMGYILFI